MHFLTCLISQSYKSPIIKNTVPPDPGSKLTYHNRFHVVKIAMAAYSNRFSATRSHFSPLVSWRKDSKPGINKRIPPPVISAKSIYTAIAKLF